MHRGARPAGRGGKTSGSAEAALRHASVCRTLLFFSSTHENTGWICSFIVHRLNPPKKNALCVHAVCVLGAGSGLGTRSSPGQAQAPSTALAVSVAPGRWRRGWLGGRVGWWVHPGNSIVLGLAGSVSAGLRDARRSRTGC